MTTNRRKIIRVSGATAVAVAATGTAVAVWPRCPDAPARGEIIVPIGDPAAGLFVLEDDGQVWLRAEQMSEFVD